ncbi:PIN domain-containing protein [Paludisphaera sp.]|uniref:type II toxin-antitoxin system VapC family toxin n=1 Tax=Paludisphaera sp. TaxID=2017432 RepID=UPI00301E5E5B
MVEGSVLLDTGPLVALLASRDAYHQLCVKTLASLSPPLLTCWPVLTEAAWLLRGQPRPFDHIQEAHAAGLFRLLALDTEDMAPIARIMSRYEDIGLQLADASIAYLAERERIRVVFTLDRRDFSIIRLKRNRSLRIIPSAQ